MKILHSKKGEMYIDTSLSIIIVLFILIFCIFSLSLLSKKIICDRISYSLCEKASAEGEINENVNNLIWYYKTSLNVDFDVSFDFDEYENGKIQLGEKIVCTVKMKNIFFPLFDGFYYEISSSNVSLSKVYFK